MNKIKQFFGNIIGGFKSTMKSIFKIIGYAAAVASLGYAIIFAFRNVKNGKPIHINLLAGFIHGIGKVFSGAIDVVSSTK